MNEKSPEECRGDREVVTREELYTPVWAEPMLNVAETFELSSSYLARVCILTNIPCPERGYWAKQAVGKALNESPERGIDVNGTAEISAKPV